MRQAATAQIVELTGEPAWRNALRWLRAASERRRQRLAMAELNDDLLRDIGLTREQARRECAQPFWR